MRELKRKSAGMHGFMNSEENPAWPCVRKLKKSLRGYIPLCWEAMYLL